MGNTISLQNTTFEHFPSIVPVFPLSGVLLLPHGKLPLNIFEPRYLQMIEDAMSSHRMIGMAQPVNPMDKNVLPEIYPTGCLGKITSFSETEDERYFVTLTGLARFNIIREMPANGLLYRQVNVNYTAFGKDLDKPEKLELNRDILLPALKNFFELKGLSANWDAINKSDDIDLLTSLAMICPFSPSEKQALLECVTSESRANMLVALIEMARHDTNSRNSFH